MAEVKSPSIKDLLLLLTGFYVPKSPPQQASSGQQYWLTEGTNNEDRELRESKENSKWANSPMQAWEGVRFRDWLLTALFGAIADHKSDFVAISEPVLASIDVLGKEFTNDMHGLSETIKEALKSKTGHGRTLFNTLSFGISKHDVHGKEVFMFGAGMRRRARYWKTESLAIQADVEIYVPFYELPNSEPARVPVPTLSINAGIALSYTDGSPIGKVGKKEEEKDLIGVRFNLRAPFGTRWEPDPKSNLFYQLETSFGAPLIQIQKRTRDNAASPTSSWQKFDEWQKFVESFSESPEGKELLNVPIGPLLLEQLSDPAGLEDIFIWQSKKDIKKDLAKSLEEYQDTIKLLENLSNIKTTPDKPAAGPNAGQHKLGHMLAALGFIEAKDSSYKFKITENLTVWDVVNRLFAQLDGYPIYLKGANPANDKEARVAVSFASQTSEANPNLSHFGLAGALYNIPLKTVPPDAPKQEKKEKSYDEIVQIIVDKNNFARDRRIFWDDEEEEEFERQHRPKPDPEEEKSTVEVFLHLGKWFSDETIDDNWYKRLLPLPDSQQSPRVPVPGIRILPFKRVAKPPALGNPGADFSWSLRADLLSLGIDIKSATKEGFTFLKGVAGYFGLGAVEIRLALSTSLDDVHASKEWYERFSLGVGVKLKDLRLSFGPQKEEEKKPKKDDFLFGLQQLLNDKPEEKKVKTRLSAKKKDKFSLSFGYLTQLTAGSKGTLDVQLYDEKGNRGQMALIEIDRSAGPFYLRRIGIALEGVENLELANGLADTARLTVGITGGLRFQVFELGVINGKLRFQLNDASAFTWGFDGLDVSFKVSKLIISGTFFRSGVEWAGMLTCDFPKASFSAMGFYGNVRLAAIDKTPAAIAELNGGKLPKELADKLAKKDIKPAASNPITASGKNEWELHATNNGLYPIIVTNDDGKLNVVSDDNAFFVYAMLNAAAGCGPTFGAVQFTGIAFGYGYNRRLKVPRIEEVADFPMVKMVMGEGGYQKDDKTFELHNQLAKPLEDPVAMLEKMKGSVVAEVGQQFACLGLRFTISGIIDCFALGIVGWGEKLEISLLGLARFRHPRDLDTTPICYVEMQLLMAIKPDDGVFQLQALLTSNSWIINKDCKLTGGFALFVWYGGPHKGDWVVTFGGYHPRFVRPAHYPVVPRIGVNWRVNDNLTMKGTMYFAVTPSCGMLGARMEYVFHSGRVSAWFTAFLDVIVNWQPLYFEADIGISLRVEVSLWITSLKVTIGASIRLWGPPVGGIAHIDLAVISFDINFGAKPKQPALVSSWEQFCTNFLNLSGTETRPVNAPVDAVPVVQPTLQSGRNNLSNLPNSHRNKPSDKRDDDVWIVRADELELAADTVVPVSSVNVGSVNGNSPAAGIVASSFSGKSLMVNEPLVISKPLRKKLLRSNQPVGAHPMGKTLDSVLNVTVVQDEISASTFELSGWTMEEEISALPAAVWDPAKPNPRPTDPSAKLIEGCITGIKKLKPPRGKLGKEAVPEILRHQLPVLNIPWAATSQEIPAGTVSRDIEPSVIAKQNEQTKVAAALSAAGFALTWQAAPVADVRFRELQADPLRGAVAA